MFPDLVSDDVFRLETSRLWLRWPRIADAVAFVNHAGRKEIADLTASIPHPYTREAAEKFIFSCRSGNAIGQQIALALTLKGHAGMPQSEAIGMIGLHQTRHGHAVLGYWLAGPHHGAGLMSEAVAVLTDLAFRIGALDHIHASVREDNPASRRVLEKAGFVIEGAGPVDLPLRGGIFQCLRFRLDRPGLADAAGPHAPSLAAAQPGGPGSYGSEPAFAV